MPIIKAMTIRQPWAMLVIQGIKTVENRSRNFHYRGRIAIHAAGTLWDGEYVAACKKLGRKIPEDELELGGIIGTVEVVDVVQKYRSKWFRGPYGLLLRNPKPCKFIPLKGQLGLWSVPARLRSQLK